MTSNPVSSRQVIARVSAVYALICALALGFDVVTDRSFGAMMLSVLPISAIAFVCLVVGPCLEGKRKSTGLAAWFIGALLILVISIGFSSLGTDKAIAGETIFTYAIIIMALPSSLILPLIASWMEPQLGSDFIIRITVAWIVCTGGGWLEWITLKWLYVNIRRQMA